MIDEGSDFDLAGKLRHSSHVVAMKMRNQHIIDAVGAGSFSRAHDAAGVPPTKSRPTGINEKGLARGRNYKGRLPAFEIGRASCRERVYITGGAGLVEKNRR